MLLYVYNHVICMFQFHCFNYVYEFSCKKMSLSAGVRRFRLLTMTFPDALNNRSDGTLVATKAKYFLTSLHNRG